MMEHQLVTFAVGLTIFLQSNIIISRIDAAVECDFEPERQCDWQFVAHPPSDDPDKNFQIVSGKVDGQTSECRFIFSCFCAKIQ